MHLSDMRWAHNANLVEPKELVSHFLSHPPLEFRAFLTCEAVPAFCARFDLLTTLDPPIKRRVTALPLYRWWGRLLRPMTFFVGTTVSEYVVLPGYLQPAVFAEYLACCKGRHYPFVIVKDMPLASPLLGLEHNAMADDLACALEQEGFVLMEGQALAYVPIDFDTIDDYLARLSYRRRKDIRRKLRVREHLDVEPIATGDPRFEDPVFVDRLYALYCNVFAQSEIHFDEISRDFFAAMLRDSTQRGIVFVYRHADELVGYNVCFTMGTTLIDKYVGFAYPQARELNLYFVSWMYNLEYALAHSLKTYIAGWTDPQIKNYLGAKFTMTRHAVFVRNPVIRGLLRRFAAHFESDSTWAEVSHAQRRS